MTDIEGQGLTTFDVSPDGKSFRLSFTGTDGQPAAIRLPTECLNQLLMTLPSLVSQALRARYKDSSLRVVFPAAEWRLESSDDSRLILTIGTGGGFEASFIFERNHLRDIGETVKDDQAVDSLTKHHLN